MGKGITPAHAGKSTSFSTTTPNTRDHPRTRGEKFVSTRHPICSKGSPPHTRGKVEYNFAECCKDGITPAHAGKSNSGIQFGMTTMDHPRTRGEKYIFAVYNSWCRGSPPHTRGKVYILFRGHFRFGITPAHAGKSLFLLSCVGFVGDHPRTRGEKYTGREQIPCNRGSPPHTRGKEQIVRRGGNVERITPAHAGKSVDFHSVRLRREDHPRTRGEKRHLLHLLMIPRGSPPHTRGKDPVRRDSDKQPGITPAHAGKSFCFRNALCGCGDHPRTRGEKFSI